MSFKASGASVTIVRLVCAGLVLLCTALPVSAQTAAAPGQASTDRGWTVAVYPIIAWLPIYRAGVDLPALPDVPGDGGASATTNTSFEGAALVGVALQTERVMAEANGLWAGLSASVERPLVTVESDVIYGEAFGGPRLSPNWAILGGVRHLALDIGVRFEGRPDVERKPGLWDPLVGVDYRRPLTRRLDLQVTFLGGGFGVGTDVDLSARLKADWRFIPFMGLTLGYEVLYFKFTDTVAQRDFKASQTLHGPVVGLGLFF
jgi:hypothetical protein